jgi:large subunit ribosomal protein L7/L12
MTTEQILEAVDSMTVKDLHALVKALEEKYGVSAQAAVAVVGAPAAGAAAGGAQAAAPATVKVMLKTTGQQKVQLIKKIKDITGKGLKECKELVDALPAVVKEGISPEEATQIKAQLEEMGAEVELQ